MRNANSQIRYDLTALQFSNRIRRFPSAESYLITLKLALLIINLTLTIFTIIYSLTFTQTINARKFTQERESESLSVNCQRKSSSKNRKNIRNIQAQPKNRLIPKIVSVFVHLSEWKRQTEQNTEKHRKKHSGRDAGEIPKRIRLQTAERMSFQNEGPSIAKALC